MNQLVTLLAQLLSSLEAPILKSCLSDQDIEKPRIGAYLAYKTTVNQNDKKRMFLAI